MLLLARNNPSNRLHHQQGIALGPILFVIAILAILAAAISAATGSFSSDTRQESDSSGATVLLAYGAELRAAVMRMQALGVPWYTLSFATVGKPITNLNGTTGNASGNPKCLSAGCKVYDLGGGGAQYRQFTMYGVSDQEQLNNGSPATTTRGGASQALMISGPGLSSGPSSYSLFLRFIKVRRGVCEIINARTGNDFLNDATLAGTTNYFGSCSCSSPDTCTGCDAGKSVTVDLANKTTFTYDGIWYCDVYFLLFVR